MNYFTSDYFIKLQGEVIDFINTYHSDSLYHEDFIEILENNDISNDIILGKIDRDYLNDFIKYKKFYTILDSEQDLTELLICNEGYINYFMDYDLLTLLDYFTEISFMELLAYIDIYKYKDDYYAIWDI